MDNTILDDWAKSLCARLMNEYEFCGYADGPNVTILNSTDKEGNDIEVEITVKKSQ